MSAATKLSPPRIAANGSLAQLRQELAHRFPGVVLTPESLPVPQGASRQGSLLHQAPFSWVEVAIGDGGLAWLAAWTSLMVARDPLGRPALWVDTHGTFSPGDLLDLEGKLVVVRPTDPHEAHVAADIALRSGSFCMVALEMHRALHPKPLARLARLTTARSQSDRTRTPLVLWGEPPSFVAPPSGVPRTSFTDAIHALYEGLARGARHDQPDPLDHEEEVATFIRTPHSTDRLRPLDRAADRRASASGPRPFDGAHGSRGRMDEHAHHEGHESRPRLSCLPYPSPR